jgi:hypothetical protein
MPHRDAMALYRAEGALAAFAAAGEQAEQGGAQKAAADGELAGLVACLRRTGRLPEALAVARDAAAMEVKQAVRYGLGHRLVSIWHPLPRQHLT